MSEVTKSIDVTAIPRHPDRTAIPDALVELLDARGYKHSWQRVENDTQGILNQDGLFALDPNKVMEWDAELGARVFSGQPGMRNLFVDSHEQIRLGDCVLMIQSASDREYLMQLDEARRRALETKPKTELDMLAAQLEELGSRLPDQMKELGENTIDTQAGRRGRRKAVGR